MSDEIRPGIGSQLQTSPQVQRRFVPMKVGDATVYVEQIGDLAEAATVDIHGVAMPTPADVFAKASEILHEGVRLMGEKLKLLEEKTAPQKVTVEFSLTFEAKGTTSLIPVFVTGTAGAGTGLKVSAVWERDH
jgi:Trypsin-co-occurring domain 1